MADEGTKKRPLVLHLLPFPVIPEFNEIFSSKFRSLEAYDFPSIQERNHFLSKHPESAEVEALICDAPIPVPIEALSCLPSLRCVLTLSAGVDHIDLIECRRRGIHVCNAGSIYSPDVADLAVGLLIDALRRISSADRFVRSGFWPVKGEFPLGSKVNGKKVGIVGLGSIGSEVAKRLQGFGCSISYNSRKKKPSIPFMYHPNIVDLAANNDILIICCELNNKTFHIINKDIMSVLGKEGVIINVGRGALINEKELIQCLVQGELGGAGLDVFENEPHVPKELLELDNVVLSPHELVIANFDAFFSSKPLLTLVNNE